MNRFAIILAVLPALAACMPGSPVETGDPVETVPVVIATPDECDATAGSAFIGQEVTDALRPQLEAATGAKTLRVVHRNAPVTMDFRPDRLTVTFDDNRLIEGLRCG